ncbi:MAG: hypothetical protein RLZZ244_1541 [Verrucomicrobiota bacterium]|jgi:hypothetical protein
MKKILSLLTALVVGSVAAHAGCGKVVTTEGTLKSFDKDSKVLQVESGAKTVSITLTPSTKGADLVAGLVGKAVKVDAEHNKATAVAAK